MKSWMFCVTFLGILFFNGMNTQAQQVTFRAERLNEQILRVHLELAKTEKAKGVYPVFYEMKEGKYVTLGYEIQDRQNPNAYVDFKVANAREMLRVILYNVNAPEEKRFKDIEALPEAEDIVHLVDRGILRLNEERAFYPMDTLKRSTCMELLSRALNLKAKPNGLQFPDLKDHWAKDYILAGVQNNFIEGYEDGNFYPEREVSFGQACVVLDRAFRLKAKTDGVYEKIKKDAWYTNSVRKIFDANIVYVFEEIYFVQFDEDKSINRAQFASMLSRALTNQWLTKEEG